MATGPDLSSASSAAAPRKDRHIVSWSAEEDDVLRAQIAHHGTDNWTIIASQFKDKTARQCRRRWYNYLNSECKKGGWSQEEDMLLCEAQKVLGNKWTEIAKVVSGRTDNAVKNRFSTLCKKRAKDDELFKENGVLCSNASAKRVLTCLSSGAAGSSPPIKQMRSCNPDFKENIAPHLRLFGQEKSTQQDSRQPFAIISPINQHNVNIVETQSLVAKTATGQLFGAGQNCVKHEDNFLNKDDPKFATLVQQADLLCSLATKINTENTSQSMDEAWQKLQHHLVKKDSNDMSESSTSGIASLLEELDDLIVDPYENEEEDEQESREQNGQIDVDDKKSDNLSQASMEIKMSEETCLQTPPDEKMDGCLVNLSTENNLCGNLLPIGMESCPGAEIPVSVNMNEDVDDSKLQCMEYTSPACTFSQVQSDAIIPESKNFSEVAEGSQLQCMECTSPAHMVLQVKVDTEIPTSENFEISKDRRIQCMEYHSPAHTVLQTKADAEILAPENFEISDDSRLQCVEYHSPAHTVLLAKADAEMPAPENFEISEDSRLQCVEYHSPAHTVLRAKADAEIPASENFEIPEDSKLQCMEFHSPAHITIQAKAGAEIPTSENFNELAEDSNLAHMEFTSPAHTVATFQPYAVDMPTPKITASEKNFLLSVLELTSPGPRPDTSQQPSCKRALLNSL